MLTVISANVKIIWNTVIKLKNYKDYFIIFCFQFINQEWVVPCLSIDCEHIHRGSLIIHKPLFSHSEIEGKFVPGFVR